MNRIARATLALGAIALLNACSSASAFFGDLTVPEDQVLYAANGSEPRSIDPHKTAGVPEANIMLNLYDCLTGYDPETASPVPNLATSWDKNADCTVWTFHLRSDATWTDGTPLTAEDFVWSWRRICDPKTASPYSSLLYYVKNGQAIVEDKGEPDLTTLGVKALDATTLEVTMEQPTAFFLSMTPHYAFTAVPRQAIEKWGDSWIEPGHHVSSGPFKLVSRTPYDRIILEKWDGHWDAANVKLKKVVLLPIDDLNTAVNLYKAGDISVTWGSGQSIPVTFVKALRSKKDFHADPEYANYYYSLNVKKPPMDNKLVRHALNMAINKAEICENILQAGQLPSTGFVPPGTPGYPYPAGPEYNPEKARELLAKAGYPGGKGFPPIQIAFNTNDTHKQIAEAVQNMWKNELGINVQLFNQEWQAFQQTREAREYNGAARDAWIADYLDPNTFLDLLAADTLNNHSGWTDAKYSKLLADANKELDPDKRLKMLAEAEALLLEEMPVIPLYFYSGVKLVKPFVKGWYHNALDQHPLKFVSIDTNWKPSDQIAHK